MNNKFSLMSQKEQTHTLFKASTLIEALPYIRKHTGKIIASLFQSPAARADAKEVLKKNASTPTLTNELVVRIRVPTALSHR